MRERGGLGWKDRGAGAGVGDEVGVWKREGGVRRGTGCIKDSISGVKKYSGPFRASGDFFLQKQNEIIFRHILVVTATILNMMTTMG